MTKVKIKFLKKIALLLSLVIIVGALSPVLTACRPSQSDDQKEDAVYTMLFYTASTDTAASQIKPITAKAGEPITQPDDPTYPGYKFGGWFTDYGTWEQPYTDFSSMPAYNLTLYAKWDAVSDEEKQQYEEQLNANSVEGHLYIHYKRFNNVAEEYEKYNLWVWPKAFTGVEFDWVRDEHNNIVG